MKKLTIILMLMNTIAVSAQDGKASTIKTTFSRETTVSINIDADKSIIWTLLTSPSDYARWNNTIISIEGKIEPKAKIKLKSTLDEKRVFKLKIKEFELNKKLVWGDGKGERVFTLEKSNNSDDVIFCMREKIGGLIFPMYAKYIPSFDASFEQFATDLKKEAESISKTKKI